MNMERIGSFLKDLRKEKGITQEQLAEKLGVSSRTISRWETGSNLPDLDSLSILLPSNQSHYDIHTLLQTLSLTN